MALIFDEFKQAEYHYNDTNQQEHYGYIQIALMVKYCNHLEIPHSLIKQHLYSKFPNINLVFLDRALKNNKFVKPKEVQKITIYKEELDTIQSIYNCDYWKVMFVLLCLIKMKSDGNGLYIKTGTNYSWNKIFKMCMLPKQCTSKKYQQKFLTELGSSVERYLEMPTQNVVVVPFRKNEGEVELEFYPSNEMVLEFERYIGEKIMNCERCGKLVRKTMNNRKYCDVCGIEADKELKHLIYLNNKIQNK